MSSKSTLSSIPPKPPLKELEAKWYPIWESMGYFQAGKRWEAKPFVMAIPPPNITGRLHMGHALNNTIQDVLVRFHRMQGRDVLWIPGTDHAGIATQTIVRKQLDAEGIDPKSLSRDEFTAKIWEWKKTYGHLIIEQLKRLGCSCDWSRLRFTMDADMSTATKTAFKKLYDDGLVYRGKRMVNWCPVDQTALSDDEVETDPGGMPGFLWHIRYPIAGEGNKHLVVATTRPETLFGDVAVAVHPEDERYKNLAATHVELPFMDKKIPVVRDSFVEKNFGSGCVKITPAHDPKDFEVGLRHGFEPVNIMNPDASMNDEVPMEFRGLGREECRQKVLSALKQAGLLEKEEPKQIAAGRSYRSKAIIEYRLSEQWFVKMKPLAKKALEHLDDLQIFPERWRKVYKHWLDNIEDWCISRQIAWGHRIPAWTSVRDPSKTIVSVETPEEAKENPDLWKQDNDVLDTWFSSALWPMSTLGWPEETPDFLRYFPTSALSTAKDILFFWVARMNMMSLHFTGKLPYKEVYFHATVMDSEGRTMSKSKGNGIDPIHVIEGAQKEALQAPIYEARPPDMERRLRAIDREHPKGFDGVGADALRYTLIYLTSSGQEFNLALSDFADLGRRFTTKLWNAGRFVLSQLGAFDASESNNPQQAEPTKKRPMDEHDWIRLRVRQTAKDIRKALETYNFSKLGGLYLQLAWFDFCDWMIEFVKGPLNDSDLPHAERRFILASLTKSFDDILRLLHPVLPFITEELWQHLKRLSIQKGVWDSKSTPEHLMVAPFPVDSAKEPTYDERVLLKRFINIKHIVSEIRENKKAFQIPYNETVEIIVALEEKSFYMDYKDFAVNEPFIKRLEKVNFHPAPPNWSEVGLMLVRIAIIQFGIGLFMQAKEAIARQGPEKLEKTRQNYKARIEKMKKERDNLQKQLNNHDFRTKAKPDVVKSVWDRISVLEVAIERNESEAKALD